MKGLGQFIIIEAKLLLRNTGTVFFALAFPAMMLLMYGGIYGNKPTPLFHGHGTVDVCIPGFTTMVMAVTGIMSLPMIVANYRERKILKRFKATPVNISVILLSQIIVNFILTVIGMILLIITGKLVFNMQFLGQYLPVILIFIFTTLSTFAMGFVIASLCPDIRTANAVSNLVYFPMIFLTGATVPFEVMPKFMQYFAKCLPLTYSVHLMTATWTGENLLYYFTDFLVIGGVMIVSLIISIRMFRWE